MDTVCSHILPWHSVVCTFWLLGACCCGRHPYSHAQTRFGLCCRDAGSQITGSEGHCTSGAQTPCQEGEMCLSIRGGWKQNSLGSLGPVPQLQLFPPLPLIQEKKGQQLATMEVTPSGLVLRGHLRRPSLEGPCHSSSRLHSVCIHFLGHTKLPQIWCLKTTENFSFPALEATV